MNKRNIIMDCDPGHDDAIAMILAVANQNTLSIEAITTVGGNVDVEKNTLNALKVCDIIQLNDVPVAKGAERPLVKDIVVAESIHGESGLEGPNLPDVPTKQAESVHAVDLISDKLHKSNGPMTIVATGPLTNVAMVLIKEPELKHKIKEIVLMGGGTFGNWTPAAEFNFYVDAEAAHVVFNSGIPIRMFGLDVTHQVQATDQVISRISNIDNHVSEFIVELLRFFNKTYQDVFHFDGAPIHDACTIAYLIDPAMFKFKHVHVDIETKGEHTYGMTAVDRLGVTGKEPNVYFAYEADTTKFWDLLERSIAFYSDK
ncbi:nucleoside hydrolase [Aquisalibacillus elongatus]|uniref:Purine nucleosidase n=1 Tax=Aquisalibacillus elongatus TaxID=485577 RepID=A0A3N5B513_9BACI|nr:nucleoside hydrolase [Aquisalibacillus elongatus]RPF52199.1 purine nucleosidase [Aquisalibacillus elongatus]